MKSVVQNINGRRQGGVLFLLVLVAVVILSGITVAALHVYDATAKTVEFELGYHGQAVSAAKAGLVDSLSWFRRQTSQPVETFAPVRDMTADPPINETDDPVVGLVREYLISTRANIWGRYEVRLRSVDDITEDRNLTGTGRFWYVESRGYVFEKLDDDYVPEGFYEVYETSDGRMLRKQFDGSYVEELTVPDGVLVERPDTTQVQVLASARMGTEFRRLSIIPPADAAFCVQQGRWITFGNRCRVSGGRGSAATFPRRTGRPSLNSGAEVSGSPRYARADPAQYSLAIEDVFGVKRDELRALSDIATDDPSSLPDEMPEFGLIFIDSSVTWTAAKPLRGTAIVYVTGDVVLEADSSSYFSGILYVEGDYTQEAPSLVNGTIMTLGRASISGSGDYSELNYDGQIRQRLLTMTGQYRFSSPMFFVD